MIRKCNFFIFLYFICSFNLDSFGQNTNYNFELKGKISYDTGKVRLEMIADTNFYPESMRFVEANIIKGIFFIKGKIPNPLAFQISANNRKFLSGLFILDTGVQHINLVVDNLNSIPKVDNKIMAIENDLYIKAFEKVTIDGKILRDKSIRFDKVYNRDIPEEIQKDLDLDYKKNYKQNDSTLSVFVTKNPNSYYAFWRLLKLTQFGYVDIFKTINDKFSKEIQNSFSGKVFNDYLNTSNLTSLSEKLKIIPLEGVDGLKIDSFNFANQNYTLLDFWYSNCSPCIAQFKHLSSIYNEYKTKGFEIIGISTDKIDRKNNWLKMIKAHELKWPQYLDLGGIESSKLYISSFPSNILVDNKGKVIAVNLQPSELNTFLKSNILTR